MHPHTHKRKGPDLHGHYLDWILSAHHTERRSQLM